jgi:hypothetical protein
VAGVCSWGPVQTVTYPGLDVIPDGVAMGNLLGGPLPDIVFAAHYATDFFYRIGTDCSVNASGALECVEWSNTASMTAGGPILNGSGVAIADLNGDTFPEIFFLSSESNTGNWLWTVEDACNSATGCNHNAVHELAARADLPRALCNADTTNPYFGNAPGPLMDIGLTAANVAGGTPQLWLNARNLVGSGGHEIWRYATLKNCQLVTSMGTTDWRCDLSTRGRQAVAIASSGASVMDGAAITAVDLNASGNPDVVLAGIDQLEDGLDYWRIRVGVDNENCGF